MDYIEIEIEGKQVKIQKFGAIEGWKILRRITAVVGPTIEKGLMDVNGAVESLFQRLPEQELISLLKRLTTYVWIEGEQCKFEIDMKVGNFSFDVLKEVLKLNFEDFFLKAKEAIAGSLVPAEMPQETPEP